STRLSSSPEVRGMSNKHCGTAGQRDWCLVSRLRCLTLFRPGGTGGRFHQAQARSTKQGGMGGERGNVGGRVVGGWWNVGGRVGGSARVLAFELHNPGPQLGRWPFGNDLDLISGEQAPHGVG